MNFYNNELLSNSKELLDASINGLSKKELDLTAFLVSKKTYFDLMLEYQQALADYYISYAELVKEMNIIEKISSDLKIDESYLFRIAERSSFYYKDYKHRNI